MTEEFIIISNGTAKFIYSDTLKAQLEGVGPLRVKRVSRVEPVESVNGFSGWEATMIDGTVLGPFETREAALAAEVEYLKKEMLK